MCTEHVQGWDGGGWVGNRRTPMVSTLIVQFSYFEIVGEISDASSIAISVCNHHDL